MRIAHAPADFADAWVQQVIDPLNKPHGAQHGKSSNLSGRKRLLKSRCSRKQRSALGDDVIDEHHLRRQRSGRFDGEGVVVGAYGGPRSHGAVADLRTGQVRRSPFHIPPPNPASTIAVARCSATVLAPAAVLEHPGTGTST